MHDGIATGSPDLARLRRRFQGQVLLPAEPGYNEARQVWNAMVDRRRDRRTRMTIKQCGFPAAGVRDQFARGGASILDGLGCAVDARVTDRS